MAAEYTGLTLTAGQALLQNQGLRTPPALAQQISDYSNVTAISEFKDLLDQANTALNTATYGILATLGSNSLPALTDTISNSYSTALGSYFRSNTESGLTGLVSDRADFWLGRGDVSKFAQYISASRAYISSSTTYIAAARNSDLNSAVFNYPGTDNYITGAISDISLDLGNLGPDIQRAGYALDFSEIELVGSPISILRSLDRQGGVPTPVINALVDAVVTPDYIAAYQAQGEAGRDSDNQVAYQVFGTITGDILRQCLRILRVTTLNINTLADLLDPKKLFPTSWPSLTVRIAQSLTPVYLSSGTINPGLPDLGTRLDFILPEDAAQAWLALERGFLAIKGIENTTALAVGPVIQGLKVINDLPLIQAFTEPLPANVQQYWTGLFATGTGPGNSVLAWDILGTALGDPAVQDLSAVTPELATINVAALTNSSNGVYTVMANVLNGDYGALSGNITIPPGLPGAGTYGNANLAFSTGLVPAANSTIGNIAQAFANTSSVNQRWSNIQYQLQRENSFLDISNLAETGAQPDSEVSVLALTTSLHSLGQDTAPRGYSALISALANTTSLGGQAIVASLREGENILALDRAGILLDNGLDPNM